MIKLVHIHVLNILGFLAVCRSRCRPRFTSGRGRDGLLRRNGKTRRRRRPVKDEVPMFFFFVVDALAK